MAGIKENLKIIFIVGTIILILALTAIFKEKPDYQDPRYRSGQWTNKIQ